MTTNTTESLDEIFNLVRMSHELMLGAPTVEDYKHSQELLNAAKQAVQQEVLRGRVDTAKQIERETGAKFDELCRRVHAEPTFGNTPKHKKENFMDGAESMILVPTVHKNKLQAELNTLLGGSDE